MRVALKFGYDGSRFWGYQRQPDVRTVEGDMIRAMKKTRMILDVEESSFQGSSRTDRGASAVGNVAAIDTGFKKGEMLKALNSNIEDTYFWGIAEVENDFNPRYARQRWYRYHLDKDLDLDMLREASGLFLGEHDFRSFCKKDDKPTGRTVDSVALTKNEEFIKFDIKAQSFLWNMVRRIVSAVVKYAVGEISGEDIENALGGEERDFGLMPAHPLFLMDVSYGFEFDVELPIVHPAFLEDHERALLRTELYSMLKERAE
ncbi:MAG: tRNA pseudouridine(38-40) synthase TruA [Thermoplasmata archaeon]|nr:tRNA pseudouridine(38-40) synthase TruA [Thermoplasmata archaeon]